MRRIAGYLTNKIGKTDRKQTQKNLIEYYFIGKFKQALILKKYPASFRRRDMLLFSETHRLII